MLQVALLNLTANDMGSCHPVERSAAKCLTIICKPDGARSLDGHLAGGYRHKPPLACRVVEKEVCDRKLHRRTLVQGRMRT